MRIIGGTYKGRNITVSRGFDSRPTTDFAKEGLFNILHNYFDFDNTLVLDLFGGTGSITFEFISRGCKSTDLVEINSRAVHAIAKLAEDLGMKGIHPVRMDAFRFIEICKKQYNIIFADPPYDLKCLPTLPDLVFGHQLLLPEGWFILEHSKTHNFSTHPRFSEMRNYGSVHFSFFS